MNTPVWTRSVVEVTMQCSIQIQGRVTFKSHTPLVRMVSGRRKVSPPAPTGYPRGPMKVPTDPMYYIEMKGLISGSNNPRSVLRARATALCPQDI